MWQHVNRATLTEGSCQLHCSSCRKRVLPNLRMRAALINSLEWVWSKRTRTAQLACARLLQSTACYTQRQTLWNKWNQLENEVHLKLGGKNIVVAVVISITELLAESR